MAGIVFIAAMALVSGLYLVWGVGTLSRESRQFLAAVPVRKGEDGRWEGINFTWYGFLTANAYVGATLLFLVLMGGLGIPLAASALLVAALLAACVPASRLVARLVEKKRHTFTVGGAVFVGVLLAPWVVLLLDRTAGALLSCRIPLAPALAALAIAYALGEGFGRLACISFGCCYGRPFAEAPAWLRRLVGGRGFVFVGATRKVAYAGGLEGEKVLPVQALTAAVHTIAVLAATALFLGGRYAGAFLVALATTQCWRTLSETMRADYRGGGTFSAYQIMGIVALLYGTGAILLVPAASSLLPDVVAGLHSLWHPAALLFLQLIWGTIFLYTGRSTVTGAFLSFHVHRDRI